MNTCRRAKQDRMPFVSQAMSRDSTTTHSLSQGQLQRFCLLPQNRVICVDPAAMPRIDKAVNNRRSGRGRRVGGMVCR